MLAISGPAIAYEVDFAGSSELRVIAMSILLKIGEVWLIISAMASTFYVMIGMEITDQDKNYNCFRQARGLP